MTAPAELPADDEWIDIGGGAAVTAPGQILVQSDGTAKLGLWWRHTRTDTGRRDAIAHILLEPPYHRLVSAVPLTIEPSILCPSKAGCARHGFIRGGRWVEA